MSRLEQVVDYRLSCMDGDYTVECEEGRDYFEIEVAWEDGSTRPEMKRLARVLLPLTGFRSGRVREDYFNGRARLYCEEDADTAYQVVEEMLPGLLEPRKN